MMNILSKSMVLLHFVLSIACMVWAMLIVLQGRDYGWVESERVVLTRKADGTEDKVVRYASEYDKSLAAVKEALKARDTTMVYVQPAVDSLRTTEPFLANNHLFYVSELKRLRESDEKIDVKRLQNLGLAIEPNTGRLGRPIFDKKVEVIEQSYKTYTADLARLHKDIDAVQQEIRQLSSRTAQFTTELTGTVPGADPLKDKPVYVHPGLYDLVDHEFRAQTAIKEEIENLKPARNRALRQADGFLARRIDLERALDRLFGVREIDVKDLKIDVPDKEFAAPNLIVSFEELDKAIPNADAIYKRVDFADDKLLLFTWSGSSGDKLAAKMSGETAVFTYAPGLAADVRTHARLFAIPKNADFKTTRSK